MSLVYVVRDYTGEYVTETGRSPASNEAKEFATYEEAQAACTRATDSIFSRDVDTEEEVVQW